MAKRLLLLVILIYFPGKAQSEGRPPTLTVDPAVISAETHSVTLSCHPPSSASWSECYFAIEGGESPPSSSCWKTLTVAEFLVKTGQSSPAEVKVECFYTVREGDVARPFQHSSAMSIYIQSPAAPKLTVNPGNILETQSVTLRCQPPPSVSDPHCYFHTVTGGSPKLLPCEETLTGSELLVMSQQSSPAQVEVKCFYTVKLGDQDYPSNHSEAQVIMIQTEPPELSAQSFPGGDVSFICSLPGPAIKNTTCNLYLGDGTVQKPDRTFTMRGNKWACQFLSMTNDLRSLSPLQSHASCDYSLGGDPNSWSPRSGRYNLTGIVESESTGAPTQPSLAQTTSRTSSTAKVQRTTSSSFTSPVTETVESESTRALTGPPVTQTTSTTSSTAKVQQTTSSATTSVTSIVESESTGAPTQPSSTQTTSTTSSTAKVQQTTPSSTPSATGGADRRNILKVIAGVTFFGVAVSANFLVWLLIQTGRSFSKRKRGNKPSNIVEMEVMDAREGVPPNKSPSNEAITPYEVYCPDSKNAEDKNRQDAEGEYHVYQTIPDRPEQSVQDNMVYSLLQAH